MPKTKEPAWSTADIPPMTGKLAIVTGATGGLGYETALALAQAGATVVLAGRNEKKGEESLSKIVAACPEAKVSFGKVDLGSLASIKEFADQFNSQGQALDILVNNAGLMTPPKRETTSDGFEIQFGTNHLAHFALTARLLPSLRKSASPRVVNVSSSVAQFGKIDFDDLQCENKTYCAWATYSQSKLANLLFTLELNRKSEEGGWGIMACSAHPGVARTDLVANGPGTDTFMSKCVAAMTPWISHSAADGALPSLFAATSLDVPPGAYYGPKGCFELKGAVGPADVPKAAKDVESAKKLWDVSCTLTGVTWP